MPWDPSSTPAPTELSTPMLWTRHVPILFCLAFLIHLTPGLRTLFGQDPYPSSYWGKLKPLKSIEFPLFKRGCFKKVICSENCSRFICVWRVFTSRVGSRKKVLTLTGSGSAALPDMLDMAWTLPCFLVDYWAEAAAMLSGGRVAASSAGAGGRPPMGRPHLHAQLYQPPKSTAGSGCFRP
jgi:hypothetical protein